MKFTFCKTILAILLVSPRTSAALGDDEIVTTTIDGYGEQVVTTTGDAHVGAPSPPSIADINDSSIKVILDLPVISRGDGASRKLSKNSPKVLPPSQPCVDTPFFEDWAGRTCGYTDSSFFCIENVPDSKGAVPSEACCACGGGNHVKAYTFEGLPKKKKMR